MGEAVIVTRGLLTVWLVKQGHTMERLVPVTAVCAQQALIVTVGLHNVYPAKKVNPVCCNQDILRHGIMGQNSVWERTLLLYNPIY